MIGKIRFLPDYRWEAMMKRAECSHQLRQRAREIEDIEGRKIFEDAARIVYPEGPERLVDEKMECST